MFNCLLANSQYTDVYLIQNAVYLHQNVVYLHWNVVYLHRIVVYLHQNVIRCCLATPKSQMCTIARQV